MKAEDREVRRYVEQQSAHIVSAEVYRRLHALVALWKQEERMKKQFTAVALAAFCVLVIVPALLRVPGWHSGALLWLVFLALLSGRYWRKAGKPQKDQE